MAKKEPIYRGLSELPVQVEDRSINSPDYFRIIKMPAEFTAGINTIKFKGNPSLFVNESQVDIEILDSNGSPIYYETGLDLESAQQNAVVNVYINQDTAPGIGTVYICGTIAKDAKGKVLPPASLNLRWQAPINIDISKRNSVDILYTELPTVTISSTSGAYTNLGFPGGKRIVSQSYTLAAGQLTYFNYNNQPLLSTGSRATFAFTSSAISSNVIITSNNLTNVAPSLPSNLGILTYSSSIKEYSGNGIAVLSDPIVFKNPNGLENYIIKSAGVTGLTYVVEQSASLASSGTENSFNTAVVYFNNLSPQAGQVAKLRSYYKSSGVGEYVFSNETDISSFASEEGFTPNTFTASFAIPTTHRNDRLDFKFEFINPSGIVSKQVLESKNHLFLGGNTYVGGDDNLLTGSLYVAGSTGTGVHISGKGSAAMIRSIGYNGFQRATTQGPGGFVMYSGSIQPLLNASESYSGVGLELVANSASYFKYTTAGNGLLDIRTANFFLGNGSNSISGSNGNISISGSAVSVNTPTFFLGNQTTFMSGSNGNILVSGSNVRISTPTFFLGSNLSYVSGSGNNIKITTNRAITGNDIIEPIDEWSPWEAYYTYTTGSITLSGSNVNINTPTIQIGTNANYIRAANGQITIASGYGQIGESYQYVGGSGMFFDPYQYDLLPVYGNGSILISGSNVEIKTPKFFLGDSNTSISGSNGNIVISGSNVRVSTPTFFLGNGSSFISGSNNNIRISGSNIDVLTSKFFLGNPSTFISGSGDNIRISGSNVTVSTPTFFFGNQTNFISGSGGNIMLSGSNLNMLTPNFRLGGSNGFIAGTSGSLTFQSSKFQVSAAGIVTASQVFVETSINGVTPVLVIDTQKHAIDARNLTSVIFETTGSREDTFTPTFTSASARYEKKIASFVYQSAFQQNTLSILANLKVDIFSIKTGSYSITPEFEFLEYPGNTIAPHLRISIYQIATTASYTQVIQGLGSYSYYWGAWKKTNENNTNVEDAEYIVDSNLSSSYDTWNFVGSGSTQHRGASDSVSWFGYPWSAYPRYSGSWFCPVTGNTRSVYDLPESVTGKLLKVDIFMAVDHGNQQASTTDSCTMYCKYLQIHASRQLGAWNAKPLIPPPSRPLQF